MPKQANQALLLKLAQRGRIGRFGWRWQCRFVRIHGVDFVGFKVMILPRAAECTPMLFHLQV